MPLDIWNIKLFVFVLDNSDWCGLVIFCQANPTSMSYTIQSYGDHIRLCLVPSLNVMS